VTVAPDVAVVVRPAWLVLEPVVVVDRDARLDAPLRDAAAAQRSEAVGRSGSGTGEKDDVTTAVRTMYKRVGLDPTKTRPSSEALFRRVRKGDELPRINSLVDVINWCSLETRLPFGLYDLGRIEGEVTLRLGREGEAYAGIRKDVVHVAGRLTLADAAGPFGNPTSDSARTMVTTATTRALVVIFVPAPLPAAVGDHARTLTEERVRHFCSP
jgi:DNA/RNA-binding domain of Phe-tRNA-synthetase-like protein